MILSALKTVENGGARCRYHVYTYYCAEEPASMTPAAGAALIVEPSAVPVVRVNTHYCADCLRARRDNEAHIV